MKTPTIRGSRPVRAGAAISIAGAGLLVLAACGSAGTATASGQGAAGATVTVQDASGMTVLANSAGRTLYVSAQEKGKVLCSSSACRAVWKPLTVAPGTRPTASDAVAHDLGTLKLQDGSRQVTYDGRPLYTFAFDRKAGQVNGDGQGDSFDGTAFTWHVAKTGGKVASSGSSSGGSGYNY